MALPANIKTFASHVFCSFALCNSVNHVGFEQRPSWFFRWSHVFYLFLHLRREFSYSSETIGCLNIFFLCIITLDFSIFILFYFIFRRKGYMLICINCVSFLNSYYISPCWMRYIRWFSLRNLIILLVNLYKM